MAWLLFCGISARILKEFNPRKQAYVEMHFANQNKKLTDCARILVEV